MKQLICTFLLALLSVAALAQKEEDFASRFMSLHANGTSLECTTVSPLMMERLMELPSVEANDQTRKVLSQLKSIRMVSSSGPGNSQQFYEKAAELARRNPNRYKLYAAEGSKRLYLRRHGGQVVEIVLFMQDEQFCLINLTGSMTEEFLEQVLKI